MKSRLLNIWLCFALLYIFTSTANAQEANFAFYYKQGVTDVSFVYNSKYDSINRLNLTVTKEPQTTYIHVFEDNMDKNKHNEFAEIASAFIYNLTNSNHLFGLNTVALKPDQLSFWLSGGLIINGKEVAPDFTLGMLSGNWWLGTLSGTMYINDNSATDKGLDLSDKNGNKYCLKEPSAYANEVFVYSGVCTDAGGSYAADGGKVRQSTFAFLFGPGITSVNFQPQINSSEDGSGHQLDSDAVNTQNNGASTVITVNAGSNGSVGTASDFNNNMGYPIADTIITHMLELMQASQPAAHNKSVALNHDFWLKGTLKINGKLVTTSFLLGHNGTSDHNWWVGDINGKRYDSQSNSGITLTSIDGGETYCINDSQSNFQAVVTQGACNNYAPTSGVSQPAELTFLYADSITSVKFVPTKFSESQYSEDGTGLALEQTQFNFMNSKKYQVNALVTAGVNGSLGTALDFNNKFGSFRDEQMMHTLQIMSMQNPNAHTPGIAANQNFWIAGTLSIENKVVSTNFVIGHNGTSDQNWWIGTPDGSRFDSSTNSGLNVQDSNGRRYCLNLYNTNYYLVVSQGVCTSITPKPLYHTNHWRRIAVITGASVVTAGVIAGLTVYYLDTENPKGVEQATNAGSAVGNALDGGSQAPADIPPPSHRALVDQEKSVYTLSSGSVAMKPEETSLLDTGQQVTENRNCLSRFWGWLCTPSTSAKSASQEDVNLFFDHGVIGMKVNH